MDENRAAGRAGPPTSKVQAPVGGPIGYSGPGLEGARQAAAETGGAAKQGAGGLSLERGIDSRGLAWIIASAALGYALAFAIHARRHWDPTERNPVRARRTSRH